MEHRISIDEHIWEKVKIEAEKRDLSTDEIVKHALETFLGIDHTLDYKLFGDIEE
jgi:hypothetical protein